MYCAHDIELENVCRICVQIYGNNFQRAVLNDSDIKNYQDYCKGKVIDSTCELISMDGVKTLPCLSKT